MRTKKILLELLYRLAKAESLADVNIAAGIADQDLRMSVLDRLKRVHEQARFLADERMRLRERRSS